MASFSHNSRIDFGLNSFLKKGDIPVRVLPLSPYIGTLIGLRNNDAYFFEKLIHDDTYLNDDSPLTSMYNIPPPDHYFKALYQAPMYSPSFKSPSEQREYLSSAIEKELKELYNGSY